MANEDKAKGRMTEIKGDLKQTAGDVLKDDGMKREGEADQASGRGQQIKGDIKETVRDLKR